MAETSEKVLTGAGLAELWSLIGDRFDGLTADDVGAAKMELVSYDGTGTSGKSNPKTVTFSFAPKFAVMLGTYFTSDNYFAWALNYYCVVPTDILTTSFVAGRGFYCGTDYNQAKSSIYAKKSSDGKSISWYHGNTSSSGPTSMFNKSGYRYYVVAFG